MSNIASLHRRIDTLLILVEQQGDNDYAALDIINRSLCKQFALINQDGTLPVDFEQQMLAINQDITPVEQVIINRFEQRYPCAGEIAALLQELEVA